MQITLLGATGSVGAHVVEQAPADGHEIVALVRDPARLPARPGLTVVRGDATVPADVTAAVDGSDAVIVALGAGRAAGVRETGTRTAVEAMRATGVRRLVCLSTLGAGESRANLNLVWKYLMFGLLLRAAYADHQRQEEVVRGSGLDWTLIRPSAYTDGPRTGDYRHGFGPDATGLTLKVARADVADALLRAVTDRAQVGRAVAVSH
ncbi:NAD(P)-dependent oxidoreductase [Nocardia farcinica]|uniref:NAD(P)-dependent oxidoreductase n=1 Tax=Nocardia farcinica TaxID=37329 RepID=UPI001893AA0F|nr:SDR family oxidoreductase [Nocardia farcinica]MBF6441732.1 SDR family oxidoreductase [Nocardia farcinica]